MDTRRNDEGMLSAALNDYFGLREEPFSLAPDPAFFYDDPQLHEAFADVRYAIEVKKGLVVVTGEAGTGKTTLLRKLMSDSGSNTSFVFVSNSYLDLTELLHIILHDVGLAPHQEDEPSMIAELTAYLNAQLEKGQVTCVLIDEAQSLSAELVEAISFLSDLENNRQKLLQIVLAGQPRMETKLNKRLREKLKLGVALQRQLAPLTQNDVGLYIDFRLRAAGYEGEGLFKEDALEGIAAYSHGIPRVINLLCDNALVTAYAASTKLVTLEFIHEVARDLDLAGKTEMAKAAPPIRIDVSGEQEQLASTAQVEADKPKWEFDSEVFELQEDRAVAVEEQTSNSQHTHGLFLSRLGHVGVATVSVLLILLAGGGVFFPEQSKHYLSNFVVVLGNLIGNGVERPVQSHQMEESLSLADSRTERVVVKSPARVDAASLNKLDNSESPKAVSNPTKVKRAEVRESAPLVEKKREREKGSNGFQNASKSQTDHPTPPSPRATMERKLRHAIDIRAINGVTVSFIDGTVYLDGRVATERQKIAALQAVRSVPGVKDVRDSVRVSY